MKRYTVILTRDVTESATVTVEAKDAEDAEEQALRMAVGLQFERDDCESERDNVYTTGCEEEES